MKDKLFMIHARYQELGMMISDPSVMADMDKWRALVKEHAELEPISSAYERRAKICSDIEEAEMLAAEGGELGALAREELPGLNDALRQTDDELRLMLLPKDPNDGKNVILEIRAGTGGEEAALFGADLMRMYTRYAESKGWKAEITDINETELGGVKEATLIISGAGAYSRLKFESGAHRVQRVPSTESGGRIHTSAATVAVMPEAEEFELTINPSELKIDTYRSSGAGGQHVNKTESAIRITHIPTGIVVACQDERSQIKNREKAMRVLRSRLSEHFLSERDSEFAERRKSLVGSGDRSERIRTYNFPQGRVTDHRINLTLYKLDAFLQGDMDDIIEPLITAEQAEKLKAADNI